MCKLLALTIMLVPALSWSCDLTRSECKRRLTVLVSHRLESIAQSFGSLEPTLPADMKVRFMSSSSSERKRFAADTGYDPDTDTLYLAQRMLGDRTPRDLRDAEEYWPFHTSAALREKYPVIRTIDGALWNAFLQESASRRGLTWPHADCRSPDSALRLPCEMLRDATVEYTMRARERMFNTNRIDDLWPANYSAFAGRLWRNDNREAIRVRVYGGLLLVRPLIRKLGLVQGLAYFAQTPFRVEQNNMQKSAIRYQERALRTAM